MATRPSSHEQRTEVEKLETGRLLVGERYFVVSTVWWESWIKFVEGSGDEPGKIDNSHVVTEEEGEKILMESGVVEGKDYVLKVEGVWTLLKTWYGATDEVSGLAVKNEKGETYVDMYPVRFHIYFASESTGEPEDPRLHPLVVPRSEQISKVEELLESHLEKHRVENPYREKRFWICEGTGDSFVQVRNDVMDEKIKDVLTGLGTWKLLVEFRDSKTGAWPKDTPPPRAPAESPIAASLRRRAVSFLRDAPQEGQRMDAKRSKDNKWHEAVIVQVYQGSGSKTKVTVHFLSFDPSEDEDFFADDETHLQPPYTRVPDWRTQLRKDEEVEVHRSALSRATPVRSYMSSYSSSYSSYSSYSSSSDSKGIWLIAKVKKFNRRNTAPTSNGVQEEDCDVEMEDLSPSSRMSASRRNPLYKRSTSPKRSKTATTNGTSSPSTSSPNSPTSQRGSVLVEVRTGTFSYDRKEVWIDLDSEEIAQRYTHLPKPKTTYGPQGVQRAPEQSGVVGLRNLGNTCFMNSMLQCLSFTLPLTNFFLRGEYEDDLNRKNPLGTGGKLAEAYADLIRDIWSDNYTVIAPTEFKQQLGRAFTQFQGYQQQDSHELFSLLVDALHEDLNRVKEKPYTEGVEGEGRPDDVVARESWEVFKQRNDSVVVDCMMGLLRSHLTCPRCNTEAIKFDPYSNWSVPIPKKTDMEFNVVLYPLAKPGYEPELRRFVMNLPRGAEGCDAAAKIHELTGILEKDLLVFSLTSSNTLSTIVSSPIEQRPIRSYRQKLDKVFDSDVDMVVVELNHTEQLRKLSNQKASPQDDMDAGDLHILELCFSGLRTLRFSRIPDFTIIQKNLTHRDLHKLIWDKVMFMFDESYTPPNSFLAELDLEDRMAGGTVENQEGPYVVKNGIETLTIPIDDRPWSFTSCKVTVCLTSTGLENLKPQYKQQAQKPYRVKFERTMRERDVDYGLGPVEYDESAKIDSVKGGKAGFDIYSCFDKFREREQLGENDEWYCPKCQDLVRAFKQMDLWTAPEILVIHLKRFYYERNQYIRSWVDREKIGDLVHFPLQGLDLSDYIRGWKAGGQRPIYDLYGVSNHIGGMGGGHYTAYVHNEENNKWYLMDDSMTSVADAKDVVSPQAYVLFYRLRV